MGRRKDSAGSCPLGTLRVGLPFKVDTLPRGPLRCLPRSYRVLGSALPGMFKGLGVLLLRGEDLAWWGWGWGWVGVRAGAKKGGCSSRDLGVN